MSSGAAPGIAACVPTGCMFLWHVWYTSSLNSHNGGMDSLDTGVGVGDLGDGLPAGWAGMDYGRGLILGGLDSGWG